MTEFEPQFGPKPLPKIPLPQGWSDLAVLALFFRCGTTDGLPLRRTSVSRFLSFHALKMGVNFHRLEGLTPHFSGVEQPLDYHCIAFNHNPLGIPTRQVIYLYRLLQYHPY